jgi:hypothetical protein
MRASCRKDRIFVPIDDAFVNSSPHADLSDDFVEQKMLSLSVGPGTFLVFGRVVVGNQDGDAQQSSARLTSKNGSNLIDSVTVRIAGRSSSTVSLQGTLIVASNSTDVIDIRFAGFRAFGQQPSLFALQVARLRFGA